MRSDRAMEVEMDETRSKMGTQEWCIPLGKYRNSCVVEDFIANVAKWTVNGC